MRLSTLGGLELLGSDFRRTKPLLLLSYLVVEGPKDRRFLAEFFWAGAADHLNSLARALSQLRQVSPDIIRADDTKVWPLVDSDVAELLTSLDEEDGVCALELYKGPFLDNFYLQQWSVESEEWVYSTREFIAARLRGLLLNLGEQAAAQGQAKDAVGYAEKAFNLSGAPEPEPDTLKRIHSLLSLGNSPYTPQVRAEAESYGLTLAQAVQRAEAHYKAHHPEHPNNLTSRGTTFVGRELESAELGEMLRKESCRLITLLGQGGTGKTRLALQVAQEQIGQERFADGVYFIQLESLLDASAIPNKIAEALELSLSGQDAPEAQLQTFLQAKDLLLVLDNFERLLEGASFVSHLLRFCPKLKLLVTSRAQLQLEEEWVFSLGGLLYPRGAVESEIELNRARDFEAVDLFVERALQTHRGFSLNQDNLSAVAAICNLVDGLPLALELAASWVKAIPLQDIAAELEKNIDILSTQLQNVPHRHQSIRATFEYSWTLLSAQEQTVLKTLSVFRGGFTRSAAAEVADASIPILASLVSKSLLQTLPSGRYDLHPLLQGYLQEKLAEDKRKQAEVLAKHGAHYFGLLEQFSEARRGPKEREMLDRVGAALDNCLAAWRWAIAETKVDYFQHAENLCVYFDKRARCQEGIEVFEQAASSLNEADPGHHLALSVLWHRQAKLWLVLRRAQQAKEIAERSVAIARPLNNEAVLMKALTILGAAARSLGDYRQANLYFQEALKLAGARDGAEQDAGHLINLARSERELGNFNEAQTHLQRALALKRESGDQFGEVMVLLQLGILSETVQDFDAAEAFWQKGLELALSIDYSSRIPYLLYNLGSCYVRRGAYAKAQTFAQRTLDASKQHADPTVNIIALNLFGRVASGQAQYDRALNYLQQALTNAWHHKALSRVLESLVWLAELHAEQGKQKEACSLLQKLEGHLAMDSHVTAKAQILFGKLGCEPSLNDGTRQSEDNQLLLEDIVTPLLSTAPTLSN